MTGPCRHCPVASADCPAVRIGHTRYCDTVDPEGPAYQPEMAALLRGEPHPALAPPEARPTPEPGGPPGPAVRTVFSVDGSAYLGWQARILSRSFRLAGMRGRLTRVVSAGADEPIPDAGPGVETVRVAPAPGDYPPANKPSGLAAWLAATPPADEVLHLVDPDVVYLSSLEADVDLGRPAAERVTYLDVESAANRAILARHSAADPDALQPIGCPLLIHRADLGLFAGRWAELTASLRADPEAVAAWGWVCEMWACVAAAAEAGVRFRLDHFQQVPGEPFHDRPLIHYTYDVEGTEGYRWSKRGYEPWSPIAGPPPDVCGTGRALLEHLAGAIREFSPTPDPDAAAIEACDFRRSTCGCLGKPAVCLQAGQPAPTDLAACKACLAWRRRLDAP